MYLAANWIPGTQPKHRPFFFQSLGVELGNFMSLPNYGSFIGSRYIHISMFQIEKVRCSP